MESMPKILYGTAWKDARTTDLVYTAFKQGFRGVDTAAQRKHYREDLVGLGIQKACEDLGLQRSDIWIQTKYVIFLYASCADFRFTPIKGQDPEGSIPYDPAANVADQVCSSFTNSLHNLHPGSDIPDIPSLIAKHAVRVKRNTKREEASLQDVYIDSYVLHSPLSTLQATLEAWAVMEALIDAGLVRYIGFSSAYMFGLTQQTYMTLKYFLYFSNRQGSSQVYCRIDGMHRLAMMCHY